MSFYVREGFRVGPIRFNLSKTGVGASLGVKGFRLGTGPKGEYVHVGEGPVRYRKYKQLGSSGETSSASDAGASSSHGNSEPETLEKDLEDSENLEASADASSLAETDPEDMVKEINAARSRWRTWPLAATASTALLSLSAIAAVVGAVVTVLLYQRDQVRKTVALFYDFEGETREQYETVCRAFSDSAESDEIWNAEIGFGSPDSVTANIPVPTLSLEEQSLYFFPERILRESNEGVEALSYQNLRVDTTSTTQKREASTVPTDAKVVDSTWKHTTKDGSRDKRYKDNPRIQRFRIEGVRLKNTESSHSLKVYIGFSKKKAATAVSRAIRWLPIRLGEQAAQNKSGKEKPEIPDLDTSSSDGIFHDLSDRERKALRIMVKKFREEMSDEEQKDCIRRVSNRAKEAGDFLQKIRDMQKRGEKIDRLADQIISRLNSGEDDYQAKDAEESQEDKAEVQRAEDEEEPDTSVQPYEKTSLDVQPQESLHDISTPQLAEWVKEVVLAESPIHKEVAARRVANAAGVSRMGSRIQDALDEAIQHAVQKGWVRGKRHLLFDPDQEDIPVRDRSDLEGQARDIEYIPGPEIAKAVERTTEISSRTGKDELIQQVGKQLGFKRSGSKIQERIGSIIDTMVDKEMLASENNHLVVAE